MRRSELIAGVVAALLGVLGLGYALLGPTGSYSRSEVSRTGGSTTTTGTTTLLEWQGIPPFMIIMFVLVIGVAVTAYLHSRHQTRLALALLWGLSLLVVGGTLLSMFSIGVFLMPAALFALLAAFFGIMGGDQATRPQA